MKNIFFILSLICICPSLVLGQTSKEELFNNVEKTAGVHYIYPAHEINDYTPVPKGYEPFYISHFGRHGSRYLINDSEYKNLLDLLEDAHKNNALTELGIDVLNRIKQVWTEAEFRGGDLSSVGLREQRGIAERMYRSYPEIFTKEVQINACATTVVRCVLSMDAFCERLKELNPTLHISRQSGMKWQRYLNHHTKEAIEYRSAQDTWKEEYRKFEEKHVNPDRLINTLFSDQIYILRKVNPKQVMWQLYSIAGGMQNIETKLTFYDIFEKEELFDLWQCKNYRVYVNDANYALNGGIMMENCKPLLQNILNDADSIITAKTKGADLRFAHDGNIIPLAMLLHLDGCYNSISEPNDFYKVWSDFKVAPMAGNIQIIFYQNKKTEDIIVKFMLHEKEISVPPIKTDIAPFYHWKDVEDYYKSFLNK